MSEPRTAALVEYVRIVASYVGKPLVPYDALMLTRAADRLVALDNALCDANEELGMARAYIKDVLPDDVSIEQLVATYNAAMRPWPDRDFNEVNDWIVRVKEAKP